MSWLSRFRNALSPHRLDSDLADEIRDHLERRATDLQNQGLSEMEARRQAARMFGNASNFRERSRELKLSTGFDETLQDLRYAWRGMRRSPGFAVTAVVSLGLAIGANTAIYSIVDAGLLRSLPLSQPNQLVVFTTSRTDAPGASESGDDDQFSYPLYEQLRDTAAGSAGVALFDSPNRVEAQVSGPEGPHEHVIQQFVSPNAFEVLGVSPALGQLFSPEQDHYPSPRAVVVLSYDFWQRRLGGDPAVLGQRLIVDGRTYSIAGIARSGFSGVMPGKFVDVWLPVTTVDPDIFTNPNVRMFYLMGRRAAGVSEAQLAARLQPLFHRHQETRVGTTPGMPPAMEKQLRALVLEVHSGANGISAFRRTFSRPLWVLLGVSICIVLIACANVASLLLARSTARSAEMALRVSLGARRSRLMRQLLTESLLISLLAGLCGWVTSQIAGPALVAAVSTRANPVRLDLAPDAGVFLVCTALCAMSALLFGLLPAWHLTGIALMDRLRHTGAAAGHLRIGRLFVGGQVAFAFCLVTGGAAFLFSLRNLEMVDSGFDPTGVTVLTMSNTPQRSLQFTGCGRFNRASPPFPR